MHVPPAEPLLTCTGLVCVEQVQNAGNVPDHYGKPIRSQGREGGVAGDYGSKTRTRNPPGHYGGKVGVSLFAVCRSDGVLRVHPLTTNMLVRPDGNGLISR